MFVLTPRAWQRRTRLWLLAVFCLVPIIALVLAPRVPLGPSYHSFVDQRTMLGLPNAWDVLSNIPFLIVGAWGLLWLMSRRGRSSFVDGRERVPYLVFFLGVMLTGAGSFWYHMAPSNSRLPWDLLPMTCSFVSLVVATWMERVNLHTGFVALFPMLLLGISTVVYWELSTAAGHGDYKYYLFLQFFSPVVLALLIGLFPPRYSGMRYLAVAFALYVAAKLFETYDGSIYRHLGRFVSGHSLKHVTAAVACYWVLEMLRQRHPLSGHEQVGDALSSYVKTNKDAADIAVR